MCPAVLLSKSDFAKADFALERAASLVMYAYFSPFSICVCIALSFTSLIDCLLMVHTRTKS